MKASHMVNAQQELRAQQIDALKLAFRKVEQSQTGYINLEQLGRLFASIGVRISQQELVIAFKQIDDNCNGLIEECQFLEYMKKLKTLFKIEKYTQKIFDLIHNQNKQAGQSPAVLSQAQFNHLLLKIEPTLKEEELVSLWIETDANRDGFITKDEFIQFMIDK